jgi:hypothetical protein
MIINGRNLQDIIAEAKAAVGQSPAGVPLMTQQTGTFGQPTVPIWIEVNTGKILLRPSPDGRWHVNVAHEKTDQVNMIASGGLLKISVKPIPRADTVLISSSRAGRAFIGREGADSRDIRQEVLAGRRGVSIIDGVVVSGGSAVLVEVQLPLGFHYQVQGQTMAGNLLLDPEKIPLSSLSLKTGAGDIIANLERTPVNLFVAKTGAGDIDARLSTVADGRVELTTGAGDIDLVLGQHLAIDLWASTSFGNCVIRRSDLVEVRPGLWQSRGGAPHLGIRASTGTGKIKVQ